MPYSSDKQRKWAHTAAGLKALGGKSKVGEWDKASKGIKLPEVAPISDISISKKLKVGSWDKLKNKLKKM